jgi:hypothetical protein
MNDINMLRIAAAFQLPPAIRLPPEPRDRDGALPNGPELFLTPFLIPWSLYSPVFVRDGIHAHAAQALIQSRPVRFTEP